jgi:hypothetical protein
VAYLPPFYLVEILPALFVKEIKVRFELNNKKNLPLKNKIIYDFISPA